MPGLAAYPKMLREDRPRRGFTVGQVAWRRTAMTAVVIGALVSCSGDATSTTPSCPDITQQLTAAEAELHQASLRYVKALGNGGPDFEPAKAARDLAQAKVDALAATAAQQGCETGQ